MPCGKVMGNPVQKRGVEAGDFLKLRSLFFNDLGHSKSCCYRQTWFSVFLNTLSYFCETVRVPSRKLFVSLCFRTSIFQWGFYIWIHFSWWSILLKSRKSSVFPQEFYQSLENIRLFDSKKWSKISVFPQKIFET